MNVSICTPTAGSVKARYTTSLLGMVTHYLNTPVVGFENQRRMLGYTLLIGSNIAEQREQLVEQAFGALSDPTEEPVSHVLFIDDDMAWNASCLNDALARDQSVVLANYRKKQPPWSFTARRMMGNRTQEVVTDESSRGLEMVDFGGFGFCLIKAEVLKKMTQPRFFYQYIDGHHTTEDYPFFKQIQERGIAPIFIDHDLSKKVWHIGDYPHHYSAAPVTMGVQVRDVKAA